MKRLLFVFVISAFHLHVPVTLIYLRHNRAAPLRCDDSLQSVQEGFRCPSNKAEWEERAKEMKCETFTQNCTETNNFVYHCLINAWRNGTIGVCAPKVRIAGSYCAEFSKGGARVQAQHQPCKSCPFIYISSESYRYQECYALVKTPEMSTKMSTEPQISEKPDIPRNEPGRALTVKVISSVISALFGTYILLLVLLVLCLRRQRHSKQDKQAELYKKDKANDLQLNEDLVEYLCEVVEKEPNSLKEKLLSSPYCEKYANSKPKPNHQQINVTGNFQEDMSIQAAADTFDVKIYVNVEMQDCDETEETVVCFFPKNSNAEKWIKISVDKNKTYRLLSDCVKCREKTAQLTYDHVFEWQDGEDILDMLSKEESANKSLLDSIDAV